MKKNAIVADIQRCSTHDGPGIRTTVFLKGCPLNCAWCHNPECISFEIQELFYADKCIGCGKCAQGCFSGARVKCGREMTTEEIMNVIRQDRPYFGENGGVTVSGGEPLAQPEALTDLIDACHAEGIRVAVETSLLLWKPEVLGRLDLILADLKIWDDETHRRYTGVSNRKILEHWRQADQLGIPLIMHTPVIPEIDQGIPQISAFAKDLSHVVRYELLPYHPLGNTKRAALGQQEPDFTVPDQNLMKELNQYAFLR